MNADFTAGRTTCPPPPSFLGCPLQPVVMASAFASAGFSGDASPPAGAVYLGGPAIAAEHTTWPGNTTNLAVQNIHGAPRAWGALQLQAIFVVHPGGGAASSAAANFAGRRRARVLLPPQPIRCTHTGRLVRLPQQQRPPRSSSGCTHATRSRTSACIAPSDARRRPATRRATTTTAAGPQFSQLISSLQQSLQQNHVPDAQNKYPVLPLVITEHAAHTSGSWGQSIPSTAVRHCRSVLPSSLMPRNWPGAAALLAGTRAWLHAGRCVAPVINRGLPGP